MSSNDYTYKRVGSRCHGFRLSKRRLSIQRLRAKFFYLVRISINKWRSSCRLLKRGIVTCTGRICSSSRSCSVSNCQTSSSRSSSSVNLISNGPNGERTSACRLKSLARTNSFYTEAIADCLEFIKRSSVSVDHRE